MNDEIIVTIGMCARNEERTIRQAIVSVLKQDFPKEKMEVIIVDDGSTDKTLSIIQEYASNKEIAFTVFTGTRWGLGKARNLVLDYSKGKYVIWVDADMTIPKDFTRKQVEFMEKNHKTGIAGAKFYGYPEKDLLVLIQNLEWIAMNHLIKNNSILNTPVAVMGGSIFRIQAVRQIGGFDTSITGAGEDEEIERKMKNAGWLVHKGTDTYFLERRKNTWRAVWDQFFWYGSGAHYLMHNKIRKFNPKRLYDALSLSALAFKITGKKEAFLLPLQYYFKRIAWYAGYIYAHFEGYGH